MVETDIKHRCFYVEEELLPMPSHPEECQRVKLKRKKSGYADGTSSKKSDSGIDKVHLSSESFVCHYTEYSLSGGDNGHGKPYKDIRENNKGRRVTRRPRTAYVYIDKSNMVIKCRWCKDQFKGSCQLKHLNQHIKKSSSHSQQRKRLTERGVEQSDIRNFLLTH